MKKHELVTMKMIMDILKWKEKTQLTKYLISRKNAIILQFLGTYTFLGTVKNKAKNKTFVYFSHYTPLILP